MCHIKTYLFLQSISRKEEANALKKSFLAHVFGKRREKESICKCVSRCINPESLHGEDQIHLNVTKICIPVSLEDGTESQKLNKASYASSFEDYDHCWQPVVLAVYLLIRISLVFDDCSTDYFYGVFALKYMCYVYPALGEC